MGCQKAVLGGPAGGWEDPCAAGSTARPHTPCVSIPGRDPFPAVLPLPPRSPVYSTSAPCCPCAHTGDLPSVYTENGRDLSPRGPARLRRAEGAAGPAGRRPPRLAPAAGLLSGRAGWSCDWKASAPARASPRSVCESGFSLVCLLH